MGLTVLVTAVLVSTIVRDSPADLGWRSPASPDEPSPPDRAGQPLPFWESLRIVLRVPDTWLIGGYALSPIRHHDDDARSVGGALTPMDVHGLYAGKRPQICSHSGPSD